MSPEQPPSNGGDALLVLLPLLIVLSTFLFLLLSFLICALVIRRRRGIVLGDSDGPVDMSREDLIDGDGGFDGVESRWLEGASENDRRTYLRAKGLLFHAVPCLTFIVPYRISNAIPAQFPPHRHYPLPVLIDSRKGCLRLVF